MGGREGYHHEYPPKEVTNALETGRCPRNELNDYVITRYDTERAA